MESNQKHDKLILNNAPFGQLGLIPVSGCEKMGREIDYYLKQWRTERQHEHEDSPAFAGYQRPTYIIDSKVPRFGTGEGKGVLYQSVRGMDLYILVDVVNYSETYRMFSFDNHMSPDDHFQNLKRVIAAVGGKARRITVIMPYLYESIQSKRTTRESLDCALALQELVRMGVDNILTFDAHDPRVQNAIPLNGFDTVQPAYQFIKGLLNAYKDLQIDSDHMLIISPDEGGMKRAVYFANVMGLDMGMFYKRRDYTKLVNGTNPIVAFEFLGSSVKGKDMVIIDDILSTGDSALEVAQALKKRGARRVFFFATFGLFTRGLEKFDDAYKNGTIDKVFTTNLTYQPKELLEKPWHYSCDMSKYIAYLIDTLNHDSSISKLIDPAERIFNVLERYNAGQYID
ncbi:MAG: ribose-phosphate pyrophosphokinase [Sarcina sp.]|uniref:ribose-phosphate pyrophosphokinase n=1 Tax=Sarcina sp. DSM 11001 TaxID=1798184 RepID=UPI00087E7BEC|nr:ribose-phosphate pyrophosphokinase [Sarcina sp. DSM 11001]MBE6000271.1 ribose-phosphate pyrophosphokinase [Sarcina sp.]MEE1041843.1 ribose-phosphate pyrophosphokinase [Lachnospiraceae bacterium]MDO5484697.1 ribose-phosphate pyrophosphokinase [Sarcina sp.]SDK46468.1 ribose-phosphate pyrophosphokinase [Sarcina sp. DSM 11001]HAL59216.1 ribose-phosphate pyrophosphokinase [Sarcina sp.]